jgi:hypothetical protein
MPNGRDVRPPLPCRALIRIAAWIVPSQVRPEWRARWDASLWNWWILFERGELTTRDQAQLLRYSWSSFLDAFWLRITPENLRHSLRSAGFVLACGAFALLILAASTHGFRSTRALFVPLPLKDPGSLVSIRYSGLANEPSGVPPGLVPIWRAKSKLLSDLAGFVHPASDRRAWVTPNFFSLMGVQPLLGRTFRPEDTDAAVLSGTYWRSAFRADPAAIGKNIESDGREYRVIGVLPDSFWAISTDIDVWTPLILDPPPPAGLPFVIGVIGRPIPGADTDAVRAELLKIAWEARWTRVRAPMVSSFLGVPEQPLFLYFSWVGFALLTGGMLVARGLPRPSGGWRYWSFLALKTGMLAAGLSLLWVEASGALRGRIPAGVAQDLVCVVLVSIVYFVACACAVWWSFSDQRRRCPVCLQRLTMPVTMGSWGSVLDPATTEFLCDSGHGSLCLPAAQGQPDRWTNLDPSWSELFNGKR